MMMLSTLASATAAYMLLLSNEAQAFPSGAGSCGPGLAVGGPHLAEPTLSTLAAQDIQVAVGDQIVSPGATLTLAPGSYDVVVTAISGSFRGVLIRAARDDGALIDLVPTTELLAPAAVCEAPVVGITHMTRVDKTQVSGSLTMEDTAGLVSLQVTVVFFASGASTSSHAYDEMFLQFAEPTTPDPPVEVATPVPMDPPTDAPVPAPVPTPTDMPVTPPPPPPLAAPTDMPAEAPVAVITERCRVRARRSV